MIYFLSSFSLQVEDVRSDSEEDSMVDSDDEKEPTTNGTNKTNGNLHGCNGKLPQANGKVPESNGKLHEGNGKIPNGVNENGDVKMNGKNN